MSITDTDRYVLSGGILLFEVLGQFGNLNVIYAHYRLPMLRTRYGILLTLLCISQCICLASHLINVYYALNKIYVLRSTCFSLLATGIFMHCAQTGLMTTISVDLFISIVFPLRHRLFRTLPYLLLLSLPTLVYGTTVIALAAATMDSAVLPICNMPLALPSNRVWYSVAFLFGGVTIVTYVITFSTIACRKRRKEDSQRTTAIEKKAMKSLSVLLVVFVVTRFSGNVMANVMNLAGVDAGTVAHVQSYNVFTAMINNSSTFYVCILRSSEYRRIFWYQLAWMIGRMGIKIDENRFGSSTT